MFKKKCYLCGSKTKKKDCRNYINDPGNKVCVCHKCVEYAERRVMQKVN